MTRRGAAPRGHRPIFCSFFRTGRDAHLNQQAASVQEPEFHLAASSSGGRCSPSQAPRKFEELEEFVICDRPAGALALRSPKLWAIASACPTYAWPSPYGRKFG